MQIFLEKGKMVVNGIDSVKGCVCADDKLVHTFYAKAIDINPDHGVNISVKVC